MLHNLAILLKKCFSSGMFFTFVLCVIVDVSIFLTIGSNVYASDEQQEGTVVPRAMLEVSSEIEGELILIVPEAGQTVRKGETLALINCIDEYANYQKLREKYIEIEEEVSILIEKRSVEKRTNGTAIKKQLEMMVPIRQSAYDRIKSAEDKLEKCEIKSPIDGILTKIVMSRGDHVIPSETILEVSSSATDLSIEFRALYEDLWRYEIQNRVYIVELDQIIVGKLEQSAEIPRSYPKTIIAGRESLQGTAQKKKKNPYKAGEAYRNPIYYRVVFALPERT